MRIYYSPQPRCCWRMVHHNGRHRPRPRRTLLREM
jgi:hypothetical protein